MLDITAISKTFHPGTPNARQALRQLSLHLEDGEFATIVGSNGAGKSTLFGAIAGSFYTDEGHILLDGTDLTIIAAGETVYHAYQAGLMLREKGIQARVLDMSSIKPVDVEAIRKAAEETGRIITVEEHSRFGGLGAIVVLSLIHI